MVNSSINSMIILSIVITLVMFSGCTENNGGQPQDDDNNSNNAQFIHGNAVVENIDIMILESFPVQVMVKAAGYLPDGCTKIDNVTTSREGNTFTIGITTIRPADAICTQAIAPFEESIPLNVLGLRAGTYNVTVNTVSDSFELHMDNAITEDFNGSNMELKTGDIFYINLNENPTTGFSWQMNTTDGLVVVSDEYIAPDTGLVGAGGVHEWEMRAVAPGTQQVTAVYRRSWEDVTGDEQIFGFTIEVV
ncbi:MAG: protease inhibitor I42 family protein [ANME-2 cluster archaeon]|nr:protease inhibitor I42 family protein [ANME-2 cluster archaeon]